MKLLEIFKGEIKDEVDNQMYTYYSKEDDRGELNLNVLPMDAIIETKDRVFRAKIIGKTNNYIVTNNQEVIYIDDCISIKKG